MQQFFELFDEFMSVIILALPLADIAQNGRVAIMIYSLSLAIIANIELFGQIVEREKQNLYLALHLLRLKRDLHLLLQLFRLLLVGRKGYH